MTGQTDLSAMAWHPLPTEKACILRGSDALDWLQGQVSQDLRGLEMGEVRYAAMATATGQVVDVLAIGRILRGVVVTGQTLSALADRLDRFVIMEDIEAEFLDGPVWTVQGPRSLTLQQHSASDLGDQIWLRRKRSLAGGWDVIGVEDVRPLMPQDEFEAESILSGIPLLGIDTTEKTLVSELGPDFLADHVSYTKGCYTGQEVIHRIYARGKVNKLWVKLKLESFVQAPASVTLEGKEVGTLLRSGVHGQLGAVATAMVKREAVESGGVLLAKGVVCRLLGAVTSSR